MWSGLSLCHKTKAILCFKSSQHLQKPANTRHHQSYQQERVFQIEAELDQGMHSCFQCWTKAYRWAQEGLHVLQHEPERRDYARRVARASWRERTSLSTIDPELFHQRLECRRRIGQVATAVIRGRSLKIKRVQRIRHAQLQQAPIFGAYLQPLPHVDFVFLQQLWQFQKRHIDDCFHRWRLWPRWHRGEAEEAGSSCQRIPGKKLHWRIEKVHSAVAQADPCENRREVRRLPQCLQKHWLEFRWWLELSGIRFWLRVLRDLITHQGL